MSKVLNPKQEKLLYLMGVSMLEFLDVCEFDVAQASERQEVLETVEAFYGGLHKGHVNLLEDFVEPVKKSPKNQNKRKKNVD